MWWEWNWEKICKKIEKSFAFYENFVIIDERLIWKAGKIMAKVGNRQRKTLVCSVCGEENYRDERNVKNTTERLELNRYCSRCRKHTTHKEKK